MPIREMKENDLPQVLALQRSLAFQDWNEKQFTAEIKAGYALCVVYEGSGTSGNEILGYAIFHLLGPDSELLSIAVNSARQRTGIGKMPRPLLFRWRERNIVRKDQAIMSIVCPRFS